MPDMELPCLVFALLGFPCYNFIPPFWNGTVHSVAVYCKCKSCFHGGAGAGGAGAGGAGAGGTDVAADGGGADGGGFVCFCFFTGVQGEEITLGLRTDFVL